jgi:transposase
VIFENTAKGHAACVAHLTKRKSPVRVVVEATSTYHLDLSIALGRAANCEVMVANPRSTYAFTNATRRRAKTDAIDAASLCEFARTMKFVPWTPPAPEVLELRAVSRYLDQLTRDQTALKNQLHAASATATMSKFVRDNLAARIWEISTMIVGVEAELARIAKRHPSIAAHLRNLESIPGVGTTTATRLVAEFLVLDPTMTSKEIAAWAGLDPRPRESGTSVKGKRAITKRGNARVRHALYMPALSVSRRENPFSTFFHRVAERSKSSMVAVTATMRKMLTVAWAIFRTGTTFQAERARPASAVA